MTPNSEQLSAGKSLLQYIRPALGMKSVSPAEIEATFGLSVLLIAESRDARYKGATSQSYMVKGSLPLGIAVDRRHLISWGYPGKRNGGQFDFRIDDKVACITEQMLVEEFGKSSDRTYSTIRTFGPDRLAPKGIRASVETTWYKKEDGVRLGFSYDYVCASAVSLVDTWRLQDWVPAGVTAEPPRNSE